MTKPQKQQFINQLFASIRATVREKIDRTPDTWDGHELRVWVARYFEDAAGMSCIRDKRSKRARDFENDVIVGNL